MRNFIPDAAAVIADFNANRPMPASTIRPATHLDLSIVDDLVRINGAHDSRTNRHILNGETRRISNVVLPNLRVVVQVLLLLHGSLAGSVKDIDPRQPFAAARTDVSKDNGTQREAVDLGQGLPVHLPGQEDFVGLDLAPGNGDGIVVDLTLFEIGVCAEELKVHWFVRVLQTATVLDHLFETDTCPASSSDCALSPLFTDQHLSFLANKKKQGNSQER